MIFKQQRESERLHEPSVHPLTTLLIELLNIGRELRLLLPWSFHALVKVLIKEVETATRTLIDLKYIIWEARIDKGYEKLLNKLEVKFYEHEL